MSARQPTRGDRVQSTRLAGGHGTITDWQAATTAQPQRWLVSPDAPNELATWLTREQFQVMAPRRRWL